ncbi:MAG: ATP-dependent Clp protease ATP-binding subunit, partial [Bacteroidales bacterium]|nr:ATP-dependent Clp protease ATP-binding subunit [Bacteroidales bacterium]
LTYAKEEAMRLGNYTVSTDHLVLGILRHRENITVETLASLGVNVADLKVHLENAVMAKEPIPMEKENMLSLSKASENALKIMFLEARSLHTIKPDSSHLFLAILRAQDGNAVQYLEGMGITYDRIREIIAQNDNGDNNSPQENSGNQEESNNLPDSSPNMGDNDDVLENGKGENHREEKKGTTTIKIDVKKGGTGKTPVLDSFGYDLTKAAMEDKLDPVVGREKEIERLAQILGRRKKNNPVLIGEPGVGKSAIAEGLAIRIAKKNVSRVLLDKRVVSLDIGSIVAGTKYRGQFEERMKAILNELGKNPNIILFIDEMHTLVGAGGAAGSLDAENMLKPALARGEIQCIGATTLDEFRQFIEKDGALERRFQKVIVEATGFEQTLDILQNIKERYQKHHNVVYTDEAILSCISLSQRYITDRCLPDKAIDIMDEAGSRVHLKSIKVPKKILTLEKALEIIITEKQEAVAASDFEKAAMYRDIEKIKRTELEAERIKWQQKQLAAPAEVTSEDVAQVVSMATNIPVSKIAQSEGNKLATMGNSLKEKIIGQDAAVETVTRAIQRNRAGLKDPNKPIGTFLFLGPTGVGKTQLAKVLAQYM